MWIKINRSDDNGLYPTANDFVYAWSSLTYGRTRFQCAIQSRPRGNATERTAKAFDFRMWRAGLAMVTASDNFSSVDENGAHRRAGAGTSASFPRFAPRHAHEPLIRLCRQHHEQ